MRSSDSVRRGLSGIASVALSAVLAGLAVGAMRSDSAGSAATTPRTFDPTLICGPQTTARARVRAAP